MAKTGSTYYYSPRLAVLVLLGTVCVSAFVNNEQTKSCVSSIDKIETLHQFEEEFAGKLFADSTTGESGIDKRDLAKCLNTQTDPIEDVKALKLAILIGKEEDVCNYDYVQKVLARYHDVRFQTRHNHNLRNLFNFYVKKVLSKCKEVMAEKMAQVQSDNSYINVMHTILNVIVRTRAIHLGDNSFSAKEALYVMPANYPGEGLIFADEIVADIKNRAYTLKVAASDETQAVFDELQDACQHMFAYQQDTLFTIAEMSKRGYTVANNIGGGAASYKKQQSIDNNLSWFAVAQMCQIVKLLELKVHKDGRDMKLVFGRLNKQPELESVEPFQFDQSLSRSVTEAELNDSVRTDSCYTNGPIMKLFFPTKCSNDSNLDRTKLLKAIRKNLFSQNFLNRFGSFLSIFVPNEAELSSQS